MHQSSCRSARGGVLLMLALSAVLAGCKKDTPAEPAAPAQTAAPAAAAPAAAVVDTDGEFTTNASNPDNWGGVGRDFALTRHSPLAEINRDNVKNLKMSWEMKTDATRGHEGQPLVIGSIMYMVSAYPNNVYAIDLASQDDGGKVLWKYTRSRTNARWQWRAATRSTAAHRMPMASWCSAA